MDENKLKKHASDGRNTEFPCLKAPDPEIQTGNELNSRKNQPEICSKYFSILNTIFVVFVQKSAIKISPYAKNSESKLCQRYFILEIHSYKSADRNQHCNKFPMFFTSPARVGFLLFNNNNESFLSFLFA